MNEAEMRYYAINECKCGPEEFFVLVSGIRDEDLTLLTRVLADLVSEGLLVCDQAKGKQDIHITQQDLEDYVKMRIESGEDLEEYPSCCAEYRFTTTEKGLGLLISTDHPTSREQGW